MRAFRNKLSALGYVALATSWAFLGTTPASADVLWNWQYSCIFKECKGGSGTFTTMDLQGTGLTQYYLVTGMTGEVEGNTITSLIPPGGAGTNDDKLSVGGQPFQNTSAGKTTGIAFLTNNDPLTSANVNLLYSIKLNDYAGYLTQVSGPNDLGLEDPNFLARIVGTVSDAVTVPEMSDPEAGNPVPEPSSLLVFGAVTCLMLSFSLRRAFS